MIRLEYEASCLGLIHILTRHSPGETEETHKNFSIENGEDKILSSAVDHRKFIGQPLNLAYFYDEI
jgi:hypothetical protein